MSAFSRAKLHHLTVNVLIRQLVAPLTSGLGACMLGPSSSSLERNRIGRVRHSTASGGQIDEYERALCAPCLQAGHIFILSEFFLSMACGPWGPNGRSLAYLRRRDVPVQPTQRSA